MEERTNDNPERVGQRAKPDIIVTGMPRGGTTLLGSLISSLRNSYCISEPMAVEELLQLSSAPEEFLVRTKSFFAEQREHILTTGKAMNRLGKDRTPVTNYFIRIGSKAIVHNYIEAEDPVLVSDEHFSLAVKHNAHFLSILPLLCASLDFSIIGIIRHPIPTILSWRSLNLPISSGRLPSGEKFWPELREIAQSNRDVLVKQVMIYELIATRLLAYREKLHLLCYESLVHNPGQLTSLFQQQFIETGRLHSRNRSQEYNWGEVREISEVLKDSAPNTIRIYSMDDFDGPAVW